MANGTLSSALFEGLADELIVLIARRVGHVELCRLACVSQRFGILVHDDDLWRSQHLSRWRKVLPLSRAAVPDGSWRDEFVRRHADDAAAESCVAQLLTTSKRESAWEHLIALGEGVIDRVAELSVASHLTPAHRVEAKKALRGIREASVQRAWYALMRRAESAAEPPPGVEEGALMLVRLYEDVERLARRGAPDAETAVLEQLDELAARLTTRLAATADPLEEAPAANATAAAAATSSPSPSSAAFHSPVKVVAELSALLFQEEGFAGNTEDYYNHENSLLDRVLDTRKGIPISLSVLFAAVCERVGTQLDMIGLPGHFLLATRPSPPAYPERVFVDAFHGGELLDIRQCEQIVRSYGQPWSPQLATPVPVTEVWERMLRNLSNCHGAGEQASMVHRLFEAGRAQPRVAVPYPGAGAREQGSGAPGGGVGGNPMQGLGHLQQQQLMRMLQLLQLQMNSEQP